MEKSAETSFEIHELIRRRWSPRALSDRPIEREKLGSLLEAARWAPSCFNEQPWRFVVAGADAPEALQRMRGLLSPGNAWAGRAPLLILSVACLTFERNGKPNRHAAHDVGLAVENLVLQAVALGLCAHQMAGFDAARARTELGLPEGYEPMAMIAVAYPGDPAELDEGLREREQAPRSRRALEAIAFAGGWDAALRL